MAFELLGGLVPKEFHAVAAFNEGDAFRYQALKLHRANFGAVLVLLAAFLCVFIVVERALHPVGGAVEEIDRGPEQIFEVGFEAGIAEGGDQGVKDVGDGAADEFGFWQGAMVGLFLERPVAVELEFGEQVGGGRRSVDGFKIGIVAAGRHGDAFCWIGRAHRGLRGDHSTAGGPGLHRSRPERSGGRRQAAILFRDVKRPALCRAAAENSRLAPLRARAACRPIAL
jgi:hypothetical protein